MAPLFRKFIRTIREAEAWHGLVTWDVAARMFPWGLSAVTAITGWIGGLPFMWIMVGAAVVAAAVLNILSKGNELAYRWGAEHKLSIEGLDLRAEFDEDRRPLVFKQIDARLGIANTATFPISIIIEDWIFSVDGYSPTEAAPSKKVVIPAMSGISHSTGGMQFHHRFGDGMPARLKVRLRYGKPKAERFVLERDFRFALTPIEHDGVIAIGARDFRYVARNEDGEEQELRFRPSPLLSGWPRELNGPFGRRPPLG